MIEIVIVGAGGHGRELASLVAGLDAPDPAVRVAGFVDDDPGDPDRLERLGLAILGDVSWLAANPRPFALGIGTSSTRRAIAARLEAAGCEPVGLVAASASVGLDVRLGPGAVVHEHATITTNVTIGAHSHLNVGCAVQHDSIVGQFVQMSPSVFINGDCVVEDDVFIGTGAIVTRGVRIGAGARVGAGSTVLDDVAPNSLVVGTPARQR